MCRHCGKVFADLDEYQDHRDVVLEEHTRAMIGEVIQQIQRAMLPQTAIDIAKACATSGLSVDQFLALYRETLQKLMETGLL